MKASDVKKEYLAFVKEIRFLIMQLRHTLKL